MRVMYIEGIGGIDSSHLSIKEVLRPLGHTISCFCLPSFRSLEELFLTLVTMTFGDFCQLLHTAANTVIRTIGSDPSEEYAIIGASLGGLIATVVAQRDSRVSHCLLPTCSGDICHAAMNLRRLYPSFLYPPGILNTRNNGDLMMQAHRAISGNSDFQREFELVNTFRPERLSSLRRLLMLGDATDPVMPAAACHHFAKGVANSHVIMVRNDGRHSPIEQDALRTYAIPFLQGEDRPLQT